MTNKKTEKEPKQKYTDLKIQAKFYIDRDLKKAFAHVCVDEDTDASSIVNELIKQYVAKHQEQQPTTGQKHSADAIETNDLSHSHRGLNLQGCTQMQLRGKINGNDLKRGLLCM